jgi:hypothetical protein
MPHELVPGGPNPYRLGVYPVRDIAVTIWTTLFLVVIGIAIVDPKGHTVYPIFATAGEAWIQGGSIYGDKRASHDLDYFRYSPPVAALFSIASPLSLRTGGVAWRVLNVLVFLGGLKWWFRTVLPTGLTRNHLGFLLILVLPLSAASLHNGQSNPLILGLILATTAAAAEGRWMLAAWAVMLATVFKIYPLSIGLLIAVAFPRPFAWKLALALVVAAIIPFLLQRPSYVANQYGEWFYYLRTDVRKHVSLDRSYRDLRFLFRTWGGRLDDTVYQALQLGSAAASAAACLAASLKGWPVRRQLNLALGLSSLWMTLLGPATESASYMLLAPSLAWGIVQAWIEHRRLALGVLVTAFLLCVADQLSLWFSGGAMIRHLGALPLAAILTLVGLARIELTAGRLPEALTLQDPDRLVKSPHRERRDLLEGWRGPSSVVSRTGTPCH